MKKTTLALIIFTSLVATAGCTSMREIEFTDRPLPELLRPGDHLLVYQNDGRILDIRYVRIDGSLLRGSLYADGLEPVAIDLAQVERLEVERIAAGRTTLAIAGGIVLAPVAALGLGAALAEQ